MPKIGLMIVVFLLGLLLFAAITAPATAVLGNEQRFTIGDEQVMITDVSGRLLDGYAAWRWRNERGTIAWRWQWDALRPGVKLRIHSPLLTAQGWLGATPLQRLYLQQFALQADVGLASKALRLTDGSATGQVEGVIEELMLAPDGPWRAKGLLSYSGGNIHWPDGEASVGPLQLPIDTKDGRVIAIALQGHESTAPLMEGEFSSQGFVWTVYRGWIKMLGMSQGGDESAEVFKVTDEW